MEIKHIIKSGANRLKNNEISDAFNISRILLAKVLKKSKEYLIINDNEEVDEDDTMQFDKNIEKIINGYPLQYITENQEFMKIDFYVNEDVLIPQPDTEVLVEETLKICQNVYMDKKIDILDLCTGSGAIAVAIKKNFVNCNVTASDISEKAIQVAKVNAQKNNTDIIFVESNLFDSINGKFDIIVSNPPYIERDILKKLPKDVQNEPLLALDGGIDGLEFYKKIAENAYKYIKDSGYLVLEIGYNQKESVTEILKEKNRYENIICIKDYSNNDRVIIAKVKKGN